MRYEGSVYRPPSEAYSLIVQVTIGCSHNKCTFCSMYKEKQFRVRKVEEVLEDLQWARKAYRRIERIFLADGDALVLTNEKLMVIMDEINRLFPECQRVGIYSRAGDILRKTPEELVQLRDAGFKIFYIGAESGSDRVLKEINKGETAADLIAAVRRTEEAGIAASVTFISGLAGADNWEEHAIETGKMISAMEPSYASLLTLMSEPAAPIYHDINSGKFKLLSPAQVLEETALLIENINVSKKCVFRSNHASNYLSLKGDLPYDKQMMLDQIAYAKKNLAMLKPEYFRAL